MTPFFFAVHPEVLSGPELDDYLTTGWFRTRQSLFTTSHVEMGGIYQVHWLRFPVNEITARASHRRIRNRNKHFKVSIEDFTEVKPHHAELHSRYRAFIDFDGAWSIEDCLLEELIGFRNIFNTKCISVYDDTKLIAAGYFDVGQVSAASILHFFDPEYSNFSLGKFLILITLDYLKENNFEYYYPGYVVQGLSKMNYKLFVGREHAEYFDPEVFVWKIFDESILIDDRPDSNAMLF